MASLVYYNVGVMELLTQRYEFGKFSRQTEKYRLVFYQHHRKLNLIFTFLYTQCLNYCLWAIHLNLSWLYIYHWI